MHIIIIIIHIIVVECFVTYSQCFSVACDPVIEPVSQFAELRLDLQ